MGGWGYLLERNDSRQSALAARRAATKEQTSAAKWRIEEELLAPCLHFGGRCSGRRSCGHSSSALWLLARRPRVVSPTHPPCGLAPLLEAGGGNTSGAATMAANVRWQQEGRVGGVSLSGAAAAADVPWHRGRPQRRAQRLPPSDNSIADGSLLQGTVAAGAALEWQVSPTHPPCGLAPLLEAGGRECLW